MQEMAAMVANGAGVRRQHRSPLAIASLGLAMPCYAASTLNEAQIRNT
ncbi:hypothetical protein PAN31108_00355 [Pandoraea anhela]|uniref:Uncharacterized protein n=1 Tax=Pandoraea anhela TaxID=2508295 RepID=A0A5E4RS88_9BURK|nr:hypothetical protein PAN31108_00355 [Pandoraea anhela]